MTIDAATISAPAAIKVLSRSIWSRDFPFMAASLGGWLNAKTPEKPVGSGLLSQQDIR